MRTQRHGSAAVASAMPESAGGKSEGLQSTLERVLDSLELTLVLARSASSGAEPARAALLITGALEDLAPELKSLRAAASRHLSAT